MFPAVAAATDSNEGDDPRNVPGFQVLFDFGSTGDKEIANGYGGYIQHQEISPTQELFRICDNFEGEGLSGRPNLSLRRDIFVPIGTRESKVSYGCHEFLASELIPGRAMIKIKEKSFFLLKSDSWKTNEGGTLFFQVAKKIPLIGSPTYKMIRLRVTRSAPGKPWRTEMIVPKGEVIPASWLEFVVGSSGLGIPNRIQSFTLNPSLPSERRFDLDSLENPQ